MAYPSFSARYTNPAYLVYGTGSSLPTQGQARETESADVYFGYRLGLNTEFHVDALFWQGYGLNNTYGIADFPDGEAFKVACVTRTCGRALLPAYHYQSRWQGTGIS